MLQGNRIWSFTDYRRDGLCTIKVGHSSVTSVSVSTHGICITTTRYGNEGHTHTLHK